MSDKTDYGDAGVFYIPSVGVKLPIYDKNTQKSAQDIVDAENSGVICHSFNGAHCDYICDHADQGFDAIKSCKIGTAAFVVTDNSSQVYNCVAIMTGENNKTNLVTITGQKFTTIKWADLCAYCCNDASGKSITMVFFKKGDLYNFNMFRGKEGDEDGDRFR